jgi:hypothetical protein
MRTTTKRRAGQLALVTVAAPVAAWALEQAARRAEAGDQTSSTSRRLRQGADFVQRFGRGPLATGSGSGRLPPSLGDSHRRNPTSTMVSRRPRPQGRVRGSGCCHAPGPHSRAIRRARAFGVPGSDPWRC